MQVSEQNYFNFHWSMDTVQLPTKCKEGMLNLDPSWLFIGTKISKRNMEWLMFVLVAAKNWKIFTLWETLGLGKPIVIKPLAMGEIVPPMG